MMMMMMMIAIAKLVKIVTKLVTVSSSKIVIDCELLNQFERF